MSFAPSASAQDGERFEVERIMVPLDHAAPGGAKLRLSYVHVRARRPRGTIVFLAGGPGQPALQGADVIVDGLLDGLDRDYDVVILDQRGVGRSSRISCPALERLDSDAPEERYSAAVAACGERLGEARRHFSTYETALDVEDVRRAVGADRIIPLGVSYGGQVAGEYARRFPERVQALVLDSPAPLEGLDTVGRLAQLALPRVLEELCFTPGCSRILGDPRVMLARAIEVIGPRGLGGITRGMLYELVRSADADLLIRAELPSALQAATQRDADPLLRLAAYAGVSTGRIAVDQARYLATVCMEGQLPWAPDSDPASRPAALLAALGDDPFAPFPTGSVLSRIPASACLSWPPTPKPPLPPSIGPDLPVLILAGRADLRTPLEDQRRIASQYPRAEILSVPGVGHSVLGSDLSGCSQRGLRRFLLGLDVPSCPRQRLLDVALPAFRSLRAVPPPRGDVPARIGRTAVAVDLTLRDAARWATAAELADLTVVRGLRGGRIEMDGVNARLRDYEVVPGVRVSGVLGVGPIRLQVTGSGARGRLVVRRNVIRGVLDGKTITYTPFEPRARASVAMR